MDDLPIEYVGGKRNYKAIILIIAVAAIISFAAYSSFQQTDVDESSGNIHATVLEAITLDKGRIKTKLLNDGVSEWDIVKVDIIGGKTRCWSLAKSVKTNSTATVSCSATNIEMGTSYTIFITLANAEDESETFMVAGSALAKG